MADNASSLAFWRNYIDETVLGKAVMGELQGKITQAESLLARHQYGDAKSLYHATYNDFRKKA